MPLKPIPVVPARRAAATGLGAALLLAGAALLVPGCEDGTKDLAGGSRGEAPPSAPAPAGAPPAGAERPAESPAAAALKGTAAGYTAAEVPDAGALRITATYAALPLPRSTEVPVNINVEVCGHKVFTENVLVDAESRGLRNVVVRLEGVSRGKALPDTLTIANKDCAFVPHVAVAVKGTKLAVRSEDPVLHTTHPYIDGVNFFNVNVQPGEEPPRPRPIPKTGLMSIKCDVHKWMQAWVVVHTSPYAEVTGERGTALMEGIPPGKYPFVAWHEELGEKRGEVEIAAGKTAELEFQFAPAQ
jgi:hypothetical protein